MRSNNALTGDATPDAAHDARDGATSSAPDPVAQALGRRLRAARAARDWTLDDLADASGVSRRMVVTIEAGRGNATLGTLLRLAAAVEIPLAELVGGPADASPVHVTTSGAGRTLWQGPAGGSAVLVSHARMPDALELWQWHMEPGEEYASGAHSPDTRELLHVTRGRLLLDVGGESVPLGPGDGASFGADVPHAYRTAGARAVHFTMAVLEPMRRSRP